MKEIGKHYSKWNNLAQTQAWLFSPVGCIKHNWNFVSSERGKKFTVRETQLRNGGVEF